MSAIIKEENWIGINEAAEFLGVKPATIRDWIRKGKDIPRRKIGKAWKFKYSELEEWARSGRAADEQNKIHVKHGVMKMN